MRTGLSCRRRRAGGDLYERKVKAIR
ncbi:UNVERIFIED_CONTAM: hypothetical protein GTU68_024835, partial [Idotea baltica]|nr:hypothetical protein [Idotea baltica]